MLLINLCSLFHVPFTFNSGGPRNDIKRRPYKMSVSPSLKQKIVNIIVVVFKLKITNLLTIQNALHIFDFVILQ